PHLRGGADVPPGHHVDDVARQQAHEQEDDDRDPDQRRDREQDALEDVAAHCLPRVEEGGRGGVPPPPHVVLDPGHELSHTVFRRPVLKSSKATYMPCTRLATAWNFWT